MAGKFIVLEGIDGAGKSTQIELLKQHPKLKDAHFTFEPTTEGIGAIIRQQIRQELPDYTPQTMAALLVADRLEHLTHPTTGLLARIQSGQHIVADRYVLSSLAYQGLTAPIPLVWALNQPCLDILKPDITIFLELTPSQSMERITARGEALDSFETTPKLERIYQNYLDGIRLMEDDSRVERINANQSPSEVAKSIHTKLQTIL